MKRTPFLGATLLILITSSAAQRHGGNAGTPGLSGQRAGSQQGQGQMGTGGARDEQRLRIHATDQQRQQLRDCTQSADRIRNRARDMARLSKNATITPKQAQQWREQLQNELQSITRNQEQLMAGLSEEQRIASQQNIEQMEQARTQLLRLAELLDDELIAPELQQNRIREQARDAERAADQLKNHQNELAAQLN